MRLAILSILTITMSAAVYGADMGSLKPGARKVSTERSASAQVYTGAKDAKPAKAAGKAGFYAITAGDSYGMELSSFTAGYSSVLSSVMDVKSASGYAGTSIGNSFYYADFTANSSGGITAVSWNSIDMDSKKLVLSIAQTNANAVCMDMTYDETTSTIFGMSAMTDAVVTVNPETGAAVFAFETLSFYTLAADAGGQLYGILMESDGSAVLYTINKQTGAALKIGDTGVKMLSSGGSAYFQTMAFSRADGKLYWLTPSDLGTDLYRVDATTGRASMLCTLETMEALCMFDLPAELLPGSPERVSGASATAIGMSVKINFTAPSKTVDGSTLTDLSRIDIYRGAQFEIAHSLSNVSPGARSEWIDTEAKQGTNSYRIVAVNAVGESLPTYVTTFCGVDIPLAPSDVIVKMDGTGYPEISWAAPTRGMNGLSLDDTALTYNVYRNLSGTDELVAEGVKSLNYRDSGLDITKQSYPYYYVSAVSSAGESVKSVGSGVHVGPAYTLPFEETFENGAPATSPWTMQSLALGGAWELGIVSNAPGTGPYVGEAMLIFKGFMGVAAGAEARIVTPKLTFENANPELRFHFFHADFGDDMHFDDHMLVEVSVDGEPFEPLPNADLYQFTSNNHWTEYVIPLSQFAGEKNVRIGFHGISAAGMDLVLDNIRVLDNTTGAINEIEDDSDAESCYYNLQGVRVDKNTRGVLIKVTGNKSEKIINR